MGAPIGPSPIRPSPPPPPPNRWGSPSSPGGAPPRSGALRGPLERAVSFEHILAQTQRERSTTDDRGVKDAKWFLEPRSRADSLTQIQSAEMETRDAAERRIALQLAEDMLLAEQLEIEFQIESDKYQAPQKTPPLPHHQQRRRGKSIT